MAITGDFLMATDKLSLAGQDIVFRSEDGSKIRGLQDQAVAFEIDHIDHATHSDGASLFEAAVKWWNSSTSAEF